MTAELVRPAYGQASLADLLPSIIQRMDGRPGVVDIPKASKYVILMVDGLGWYPLTEHLDHADGLRDAMPTALKLTSGVPSTTATSLTSLGCGVPPGQHGIVGYTLLDPETDRVVNALTWEGGSKDIDAFALRDTLFDELARRGTRSAAVTLDRFAGSALTRLAFGGTTHFPIVSESDTEAVSRAVLDALVAHDVVYCYERLLDHTGHGHGVGSWQWLEALARVDDLVADLRQGLGEGVCLLVTGDHGMVNVPEKHRVVAEAHPELRGFRRIAGEGRFRQLHTDDPAALAARWAHFLGDRATVVRREAAIEAGWFGEDPKPRATARLGDVLVALHDDWAIMSTKFPGEFNLVGMHGSLTAAEMVVPLLRIGPR